MRTGEFVIGLGVTALGVFIAAETGQIATAPIYAKVPPGAIPYLVGGCLILLGLLLAAQAWRAAPPAPQPAAEATDWQALAVIGIGLVAQRLLIERAGFVVAAAVLFVCVAFGFGSRRILRDGVIAILLAIAVYVGFTRGLNVQLPAGLFAGLL
jgi:putative tricarboxylic transport membrane protein